MSASYAALQTTSHNIANASVAGYSRQQASLETALAQQKGSGFLGSGVNVATITRSHNAFLSREAVNTNSLAALDGTHLQLLSQLEGVFPTGDAGVGQAGNALFSALSDLASSPGDNSTRAVVLSRADELAQRFATAGEQIDALQSGVVSDLKAAATGINRLSSGIARLNVDIARQQALGQPPNDLLDKRDQMVQELGGYLQVSTISSADGSVGVFAAGGQRLVLGSEAQSLRVVPDPMDQSRAALAISDDGGGKTRLLDSAALTGGGSVGGMLRFQNQDLVTARNTLGQMAVALSARMNQQQAQGQDLGTPPGPGKALFTDFVAASQAGELDARPATGNARDAAGNPVGAVEIHISDATLLEADEYTLDVQAPGSYVMTRRSDGQRFTSGDGSSFTFEGATGPGSDFNPGFALAISGAQSGDRFLVQPVGAAATGLRRVLDSTRGLAAAALPPTTTPAAGNTGGVTPAISYTGTGLNTSLPTNGTLTFGAAGAWTYNWQQLDGGGNVAGQGSLSGTHTLGKPLQLTGMSLTLGSMPAAGDSFTLNAPPHAGASNGNALSLATLGAESFIGRSPGAGGNTAGTTLSDAYANALSSVGTRVQTARTASDISSGVASDARAARDASSGVNLDEEAARLIQFQQGYQAAAKVLQVAQSVFDSLLQAAGR